MKSTQPEPILHTPNDQINKVEKFKFASNGVRGQLHDHFRDDSTQDVIEETEQIAKSHGIYLEYNRAQTGREKDWMYMIRVTVPAGGSFNRKQWHLFDEISDKYTADKDGRPSLRLTTRQNIQLHWVKKQHLVPLVRQVAQTGYFTLNGCGDNMRNVMGCPLSKYSTVFNANAMAHEVGTYFRLPAEAHIQIFEIDPSHIRTPDKHFQYGPQLLNRKFKVAFSAVHQDEQTGLWQHDNCVELRTNDVGIAPILENDSVTAFQVYIGGGQGEKNGKPTFAALGRPFGIFTQENLLKGLDSIVAIHQEWGDRKNRHWARLKYVVRDQGVPWFQEQAKSLGATFELPRTDLDPGLRMLHHGWHKQPTNGQLCYGAYIENGRLIDSPNGQLKKMVRSLIDTYDGVELMITPNQDLLFTNIPPDAKASFEADLKQFGYGQRNGKPYSRLRVLSGACVGLPTCRLSYTESERFEPELIDSLEELGYGDTQESIGITGCERQCFRPGTKTIGWVGQGPNLYALKLGGSESGSHQGQYLADGQKWYLRQVPRASVSTVTAVLIDFYKANRESDTEDMGAFHRRIGFDAIISHLRGNPKTTALLEKTKDAPFAHEDGFGDTE